MGVRIFVAPGVQFLHEPYGLRLLLYLYFLSCIFTTLAVLVVPICIFCIGMTLPIYFDDNPFHS